MVERVINHYLFTLSSDKLLKRAVQTADFVTSALSEHAWTEQHRVDWSNVQILARQSDCTSRTVMESVLIRTTKDTLNRDSGALPLEYQHLF